MSEDSMTHDKVMQNAFVAPWQAQAAEAERQTASLNRGLYGSGVLGGIGESGEQYRAAKESIWAPDLRISLENVASDWRMMSEADRIAELEAELAETKARLAAFEAADGGPRMVRAE